jgi:hypothetical protein
MNNRYQAVDFLKVWREECEKRKESLLKDWSYAPRLTAQIFSGPEPLIKAIAERFNLKHYCDYYSIDAILFKDEEDQVPGAPIGTTWVRRIRIAFEHENYFNSGLFQELSHLMITDCDLRVLVTYQTNPDDLKEQLDYLRRIIAETDRSDLFEESQSFLFISGRCEFRSKTLAWDGYFYASTG